MPIQNCLLLRLIRSYKKTTFYLFCIKKYIYFLFTKSVNLKTGGRLLQVFAVSIIPCYPTIYSAIVTLLKKGAVIAVTVPIFCDFLTIDMVRIITFLKQIFKVNIICDSWSLGPPIITIFTEFKLFMIPRNNCS